MRKEEPSCPEKLLIAFIFTWICDTESLILYQSECDISFVVQCTASTSGDRLFFCMLISLNSHASDRFKNLYFHTNAYYYDTRVNDYMQLRKHTHAHPFNGPYSRTTRVGRYQKGKTNLDFTEARDSEWQWHQLGHMQVCT